MTKWHRTLAWEGCTNVRDLGGLPLVAGGETRFGAVIRADSTAGLSAIGRRALQAHGVRRIVDLRADDELSVDEEWPAEVDVVRVPMLPGGPADPLWPEFEAILDAAADPLEGISEVYMEFLERWPESFAAAAVAIAQVAAGAVVVQCRAGRDRTGLVVALVLDVCGVVRTAIAEDYALTSAVDDQPAASARVMEQVLVSVDRRHGGARRYLETGGAHPIALDRIVSRLTGPQTRARSTARGSTG